MATTAATGVVLAAQRYDVWWTALSQLANLAVAVGFVVLAFVEPRSPWLRGALATAMTVVCLAYLPMANGNLAAPWSVLEHMVTPALVLVDFLLVGVNQADVRWWHPPRRARRSGRRCCRAGARHMRPGARQACPHLRRPQSDVAWRVLRSASVVECPQ